MKKVFISQPMRDFATTETLSEREKALKMAEKILHENLMLIDTYFPDEYKKRNQRAGQGYQGDHRR